MCTANLIQLENITPFPRVLSLHSFECKVSSQPLVEKGARGPTSQTHRTLLQFSLGRSNLTLGARGLFFAHNHSFATIKKPSGTQGRITFKIRGNRSYFDQREQDVNTVFITHTVVISLVLKQKN